MMILLEDEIYRETKLLVLGKLNRSPILVDFSTWFYKRFSIRILNFQFNKLKGSRDERYRLYIIVGNSEDYQKMYTTRFIPNAEYQVEIAKEFYKIALKHRFASQAQLKNLFVIYNDFSEEAKTEANWRALKEVQSYIEENYSVVWKVLAEFSSSVIFYYRDVDIIENEHNGTSRAINDAYFAIVKKYDELGYFSKEDFRIKFESKENLDNNYEGNLFYYSRR